MMDIISMVDQQVDDEVHTVADDWGHQAITVLLSILIEAMQVFLPIPSLQLSFMYIIELDLTTF